MSRDRILITSAGSLVGWTLLEALRGLRERVEIVATNSIAEAPQLYACDRVHLAPPTADAAAFAAFLDDLVERERPRLVIPGRDAELALLADLRRRLGPGAATRVLAPPAELVSLFDDKLETARFAERHGLPFAETAHDSGSVATLRGRHGFPLVAKRRCGGHASKSVWLVHDDATLDAVVARGEFVVQPLLAPETVRGGEADRFAYGIPWAHAVRDVRVAAEMVLGDGGELLSLCVVESDTEGPLSRNMRLVDDASATGVAEAYARALAAVGHDGPANLQGKRLGDGSFVPFELNGRFTGSAGARALLGVNQVAAAVRHHLWGEPVPFEDTAEPPAVLRGTVYAGVPARDVECLRATGSWQRGVGGDG